MTDTTVETTLQQGAAVIWLDRPDVRNAMSAQLVVELTDAVGATAEDDDVRAIAEAPKPTVARSEKPRPDWVQPS